MKKLLAISITTLSLFAAQAQANGVVDTLVTEAIAACNRIETLESGDITNLFRNATIANRYWRDTRFSDTKKPEIRNVDVRFIMSDGTEGGDVSNRKLVLSIQFVEGRKSMNVECESGRVRITTLTGY